MPKVIFANKPFDSHPYFTPEQCREIVIDALLSDQIKPDAVIVGKTDKGFKVFDKSKVNIVNPSPDFPDVLDSFDLIDGHPFLTVEYNDELTEIEIFKREESAQSTGFKLGVGRLRINDRMIIDRLVDLFRTIVLPK